MKLVHFYLNFPGTAEEAFLFYETVFQTKILGKVTYGEAPFAGPVPEAYKNKLMNIQMPLSDHVHLMASDSLLGVGEPLVVGNNFYLSVVASSRHEADRVFQALAEKGEVEMPMANAPWGPYFGMCHDRFGIHWMISLETSV